MKYLLVANLDLRYLIHQHFKPSKQFEQQGNSHCWKQTQCLKMNWSVLLSLFGQGHDPKPTRHVYRHYRTGQSSMQRSAISLFYYILFSPCLLPATYEPLLGSKDESHYLKLIQRVLLSLPPPPKKGEWGIIFGLVCLFVC